MAPSPNTSLRISTLPTAPTACSGGMNAGVPSTLPACVNEPSSSRSERTSVPPVVSMGLARAPAGRAEDLGQSPIHDLHLAEGADHDVAGLQVAVDDPVGVRIG